MIISISSQCMILKTWHSNWRREPICTIQPFLHVDSCFRTFYSFVSIRLVSVLLIVSSSLLPLDFCRNFFYYMFIILTQLGIMDNSDLSVTHNWKQFLQFTSLKSLKKSRLSPVRTERWYYSFGAVIHLSNNPLGHTVYWCSSPYYHIITSSLCIIMYSKWY